MNDKATTGSADRITFYPRAQCCGCDALPSHCIAVFKGDEPVCLECHAEDLVHGGVYETRGDAFDAACETFDMAKGGAL